ncbi:hypothetical protein [Zavarzinella formosa]|uniref:hypothetical protein n=1 Tax=Zavarzinella formosa TaxID=360055 RepID=UPI0002E57447|nr:hypothetical protein [Zavarzinella formosa]
MKITERIQLILRTKGGHSGGIMIRLTDREEVMAEAVDREIAAVYDRLDAINKKLAKLRPASE